MSLKLERIFSMVVGSVVLLRNMVTGWAHYSESPDSQTIHSKEPPFD